MDSDTQTTGRDRVRTLLLQRMDDAGLKRPRGWTVERYDDMRRRLVEHLAYMSAEGLRVLAESVLDVAEGARRDVCPAEVTIRNFAHGLEPPPFGERRIVSSWLASIEGPKARAEGHLTELYRWLRRAGHPPMPYDLRCIRETAEENRRMRALVQDRIGRGADSAGDREWLAEYTADADAARALVEGGAERRAAS